MIDTGASVNCIDFGLADALQLPTTDVRPMQGATGRRDVPVYLAEINLPQYNLHWTGEIYGTELRRIGSEHGALLGRQFLSHFRLIYDGPAGTFTLLSPDGFER